MSAHAEFPTPGVRIRRANPDDLLGMTRVHVDTWKTTYRGIVPDQYLDELTYESDIARGFGRGLKEPRDRWTYLVALDDSHLIVGYAVGGPNREPEPDYAGELGAIYVLKTAQGRGVGTALVREIARHLLSVGVDSMIVWVLERNPYRRFYERLDGTFVRKRAGHSRLVGIPLPEVSYGWKDIRRLANL